MNGHRENLAGKQRLRFDELQAPSHNLSLDLFASNASVVCV